MSMKNVTYILTKVESERFALLLGIVRHQTRVLRLLIHLLVEVLRRSVLIPERLILCWCFKLDCRREFGLIEGSIHRGRPVIKRLWTILLGVERLGGRHEDLLGCKASWDSWLVRFNLVEGSVLIWITSHYEVSGIIQTSFLRHWHFLCFLSINYTEN